MAPQRDDRGATATISVVLLVAVTVVAAGVVGTLVAGVSISGPPPQASLSLTATSDGTLTVIHHGGDTLDPSTLRVHVRVDGDPLRHQPPVPFFAATGFVSGPTGAFNRATRSRWRAGETARLRVASTNAPTLDVGATVQVRIYTGDTPLATLATTVQR